MSARWMLVASLLVVGISPADAQPSRQRMVIGTGVVCREQPNRTARAVYSFRPGETFGTERESKEFDAVWYFSGSRVFAGCWVFGPMTVEYDYDRPREMLLAVVDHLLERKDRVQFLEYVQTENLLLDKDSADTLRSNADTLRSSGLLQFRRLQIVAGSALQANEEGLMLNPSPLVTAWFLGHRDVLAEVPFEAAWYPLSAPYWTLYDRFQKEPWAEELAWTAAQLRRPTDECYSGCVLQAGIIEGPLQYWSRRPAGVHVGEAIDRAIEMARYAASMACYDGLKGDRSDSSVPPNLVDSIRESLRTVTAPRKQQLLEYLDDAVKKCRG